jgi:ubiquinone/menaquinone biosynthesis C-methylase UbiE
MAKHEGALGAVYQAKGEAEVAKLYDGWASSYDAEMAKFGYRHPAIGVALLARHCPRGAAPLLDAGAGTGLVGEWLSILGYPKVEALDISAGMLEVAKSKKVYAAHHQLALGGPLPFADAHFKSIICVGVFTTGHVGPEGLDELVRICARDGVLVITVKDTLWQGGFSAKVDALVRGGALAIVEQTEPYVSMPGETATTPSRAVVLKRT